MRWRTIPTRLATPLLVLACAPEEEAPGPGDAKVGKIYVFTNGELAIERTRVIVNAPIVKWPTDHLAGDARLGEGDG